MQNRSRMQILTTCALLVAIGILIPLSFPKILLEPASYTLASHVPIMLSMFISPLAAIAVAAGTTAGFLLSGLPVVIVLRAATHLFFAFVGAVMLQKIPAVSSRKGALFVWMLFASFLHAVGEVAVTSAFYFSGSAGEGYYARGFWVAIVGLVGLGTLIHSMLDFGITLVILKAFGKQRLASVIFLRNPYKARPTAPQ